MVALSRIDVRRRPGHRCEGVLIAGHRTIRCALGRGGISWQKREGDGATPGGRHRLLSALYRPDRGARPATVLPVTAIGAGDGWCDAPWDANYNRPVRLPYPASHEILRRADRLYDGLIVVDWNISPRVQGRGSAIFLHIARDDMAPTEGCVAVAAEEFSRLINVIGPATRLVVW